jgi:DNA-binding transcriptional ArsR family regulator
VQLLPSKLWTGPPLFADHPPEAGGNVLIYATRATIPADEASQSHNLAGLLGQTRAAVLRALRTPRSTTELAACVGTSAPSASEHATALRASGLVQTVRHGRGVNHSLTPARPEPAQQQPQRALSPRVSETFRALGGNTSLGFQGTWANSDAAPAAFTVNGAACTT